MEGYLLAILGGALIGLSASLLLLFKGRIFGISGILGGVIKPELSELGWRLTILIGLASGGVIGGLFLPSAFPAVEISTGKLIIGGLLVGFGTQLGSGCTSGHGVCGISRMSARSVFATITFIASGALTVLLMSL